MNFMILVPAMVNLTFDAGSTWFGVAEVFSGAGSTAAGFAVGLLSRPSARSVAAGAVALGVATMTAGWLMSTIDVRPTMVLTGSCSLVVGLALLAVETARPSKIWAAPGADQPETSPAR